MSDSINDLKKQISAIDNKLTDLNHTLISHANKDQEIAELKTDNKVIQNTMAQIQSNLDKLTNKINEILKYVVFSIMGLIGKVLYDLITVSVN